MHGEGDDDVDAHHILQMTDREADDFGERLYSLEEKGIDIQFERRA